MRKSDEVFKNNAIKEKLIAERLADKYSINILKNVNKLFLDVRSEVFNTPEKILNKKYSKAAQKRIYKIISEMTNQTYDDINRKSRKQLFDSGVLERDMVMSTFDEAIGIEVELPTLSDKQILAITNNLTLDGVPITEWWQDNADNVSKGIKREIQKGLMLGENLSTIANRFSKKEKFSTKSRRQAEAQVRTQTSQIMNTVRLKTYEENSDIINKIEHLATLDSRTTIICISRDGLRWTFPELKPIGHNKDFLQPPLHFQCRSTIILVLIGLDELLKKLGAKRKKDFTPKEETKIRESVDGQVEGDVSMSSWLKKNPKNAKALLGKTRSQMFLDGKISLKQLTSKSGVPYSVKELRKKFNVKSKMAKQVEKKKTI